MIIRIQNMADKVQDIPEVRLRDAQIVDATEINQLHISKIAPFDIVSIK